MSRPSMRFVAIKSEVRQAAAGIHRVCAMLVKQRTMLINTLRGLMAEYGIVVAERPRHVAELVAILADPAEQRMPAPLHDGLGVIVETCAASSNASSGSSRRSSAGAATMRPAGT